MKKALIVIAFLLCSSSFVFAGGPMVAPKSEEVARPVEKPKLVNVDLADDLYNISKHWTIGIGLGGNPLIGLVEKDGFGYPQCEYGVTCVLGYGYTWISGQPTQAQIKAAIESIKAKNGNFVDEKKLPSMVRDEVGIKQLNYVEIGTWAAILPINAEMGMMWILSDNWRTRLGIGLPTLISFGINYDF